MAIVATCVLAVLASRRDHGKGVVDIDRKLKSLLEQQVMPLLELEEATTEEALVPLNQFLASSPETKHLHFALWNSPEPPPGCRRRPAGRASSDGIPGLEEANGDRASMPEVNVLDARITIRLKNVPVGTAAGYIANLSACSVIGMEENTIYLAELKFIGPVVERTFTIAPRSVLASRRDPRIIEEKLRSTGMLGESAELEFKSPRCVLVRATPDDMDTLEMLVTFDRTPRERVAYWKENWRYELMRFLPSRPPTGPICLTGYPMNEPLP